MLSSGAFSVTLDTDQESTALIPKSPTSEKPDFSQRTEINVSTVRSCMAVYLKSLEVENVQK